MQTLQTHDLLEIKFKLFDIRTHEDFRDHWMAARVVECDPGAWPLVQLSDGQMTELRPYMQWRKL